MAEAVLTQPRPKAVPATSKLSRDAAEVQRYVSDPLCGFAFTNELVRDIFVGLAQMRDPAREACIPTTLPVLVIQGELDPVGENLAGTRRPPRHWV